jgi:uncharacterized protein YkwD
MIRFSRLPFLFVISVFLLAQTLDGLPRAAAIDADSLEEQLAILVNKHREEENLPPLKSDPRIAAEARRHSRDMASGDCGFNHDGFDDRARCIQSLILYRGIAENIAWASEGPDLAARMMKLWLNSRVHRDNIEDQNDLSGIGAARSSDGRWYATQIFVLKLPAARSTPDPKKSR